MSNNDVIYPKGDARLEEIYPNEVIRACNAIVDTFEKEKITKFVGGAAMLALLESLKKEGISLVMVSEPGDPNLWEKEIIH